MAGQPETDLKFLLASSEHFTFTATHSALRKMGATLDCETSAAEAAKFIGLHKIDSVIIDLELKPAINLLSEMRRSRLNSRAFAFVTVSNEAESAVALRAGANALIEKPLNSRQIYERVDSFKSIIVSERRRFQRFPISLPITINWDRYSYQGIVENLSAGGMAVRLPCLLPSFSVVEFSFDLNPGTTIEGSAQLKWAGGEGVVGMEFRDLCSQSKAELATWLKNHFETYAAPSVVMN